MNLRYLKIISLGALLSAFSFSSIANQDVKNVSDIKKKSADLNGKQVTVSGEVDDIRGPYTFVLEDEGWFGFDDEIVVISKRPISEMKATRIVDDADITVTGTVQQYSVVDVEREMGWDLDPQVEVEWEGTQTVLVLDNAVPRADKRQQDGRTPASVK